MISNGFKWFHANKEGKLKLKAVAPHELFTFALLHCYTFLHFYTLLCSYTFTHFYTFLHFCTFLHFYTFLHFQTFALLHNCQLETAQLPSLFKLFCSCTAQLHRKLRSATLFAFAQLWIVFAFSTLSTMQLNLQWANQLRCSRIWQSSI